MERKGGGDESEKTCAHPFRGCFGAHPQDWRMRRVPDFLPIGVQDFVHSW